MFLQTTLSLLRVISGLLAYETYEWAVIDICRVAFGFFSPVSTEVCPGLIGNYGPHVSYASTLYAADTVGLDIAVVVVLSGAGSTCSTRVGFRNGQDGQLPRGPHKEGPPHIS